MKLSSQQKLQGLLFNNGKELPPDFFSQDEIDTLRELSKQSMAASRALAKKPKVYILPGFQGSSLFGDRRFLPDDWIWFNPLDIAYGGLAKLKIGSTFEKIYARDAIEMFYLKQKLSLRVAGFDAEYLPYDWRFSANELGAKLFKEIKKRNEKNVSLVCHSMGGRVARQMAGLDPDAKHITRVITLGTPNFGSYTPVEVFALDSGTLKTLAAIDQFHTKRQLVNNYIKYFRGLIEMLPDNRVSNFDYFDYDAWPASTVKPAKKALKLSQTAKDELPAVDNRFVQIIGMNQPTIQSAQIEKGKFVYNRNNAGDGTVPLDLATMGDVDRYYADVEHLQLSSNSTVISGVVDILNSGQTGKLRNTPFTVGGKPGAMVRVSGKQLRQEQAIPSKSEVGKLLNAVIEERLAT